MKINSRINLKKKIRISIMLDDVGIMYALREDQDYFINRLFPKLAKYFYV